MKIIFKKHFYLCPFLTQSEFIIIMLIILRGDKNNGWRFNLRSVLDGRLLNLVFAFYGSVHVG